MNDISLEERKEVAKKILDADFETIQSPFVLENKKMLKHISMMYFFLNSLEIEEDKAKEERNFNKAKAINDLYRLYGTYYAGMMDAFNIMSNGERGFPSYICKYVDDMIRVYNKVKNFSFVCKYDDISDSMNINFGGKADG